MTFGAGSVLPKHGGRAGGVPLGQGASRRPGGRVGEKIARSGRSISRQTIHTISAVSLLPFRRTARIGRKKIRDTIFTLSLSLIVLFSLIEWALTSYYSQLPQRGFRPI